MNTLVEFAIRSAHAPKVEIDPRLRPRSDDFSDHHEIPFVATALIELGAAIVKKTCTDFAQILATFKKIGVSFQEEGNGIVHVCCKVVVTDPSGSCPARKINAYVKVHYEMILGKRPPQGWGEVRDAEALLTLLCARLREELGGIAAAFQRGHATKGALLEEFAAFTGDSSVESHVGTA